jgi:uncharacterized RDD family membrane protein YckC
MKNIEITTAQNVTIQYGLATVWERAIALTIDLLVMSGVSLLLWGIVTLLFKESVEIMMYFTILPFVLLYSLAFEQFNHGQSLGKRALRIRVIRMDGEKTNFFDYLMRWIFRSLDIYFSFGGIAILSIISSNYSQRLGDLLANTVVVNVGKTDRMRLENLLRLNKKDKYKVTYPQVARMPEEAMLIVKETITKNNQLQNAAYEEAFELLVSKMEKELKVKAGDDHELFLKTLLKDYIILTR